jgi:hypothetical protein
VGDSGLGSDNPPQYPLTPCQLLAQPAVDAAGCGLRAAGLIFACFLHAVRLRFKPLFAHLANLFPLSRQLLGFPFLFVTSPVPIRSDFARPGYCTRCPSTRAQILSLPEQTDDELSGALVLVDPVVCLAVVISAWPSEPPSRDSPMGSSTQLRP